MTTFTADDFAKANLATRGSFGVARRVNTGDTDRWMTNDLSGELSDEHMARAGWVPVVESRVYTQREAVLALAFEQRTANLIAAQAHMSDDAAEYLWEDHIAPRLGLGGDDGE